MAADTPNKGIELENWQKLCLIFNRIHFFRLRFRDAKTVYHLYFSRHKNDHITLNVNSTEWREALPLLRKCSLVELEYLESLAKINSTHIKSHAGLNIGIFFVIIPAVVTFLLTYAASIPREGVLMEYLYTALMGGLVCLKFLTNQWQSMEMSTCIGFAIAERKLLAASPPTAPE